MDAIIVTDLGYGDSGKGSIVDYLVRQTGARVVVRYNGGAQAAHNVVTPDGRHHTFSQFGSGSFVNGTLTFLAREVLVNPLNLMREAEVLVRAGARNPLGHLVIDSECAIITPFHVAANRLRELFRRDDAHGTCGEGIGETAVDVLAGIELRAHDLRALDLEQRLRDVQLRKRREMIDLWRGRDERELPLEHFRALDDFDEPRELAEAYREFTGLMAIRPDFDLAAAAARRPVIFEGAQGVLLDQDYGFHPHTTWSRCTSRNAEYLCGHHGLTDTVRLGVVRGYATRHGEGPLPTESAMLAATLPDEHNAGDGWQGPMRVGWTDLVTLRYAVEATEGIDALAVTCLDRLAAMPTTSLPQGRWHVASAYRTADGGVHGTLPRAQSLAHATTITRLLDSCVPIYDPAEVDELPDLLGLAADAPCAIESWGPTAADKRGMVELPDQGRIACSTTP